MEAASYDLLVVGGGILGAFAAWQAARRGLSVALLERDDFGSGTTAGSGRVLHGGLRQLQHLDLAGCRRSLVEQRALRRLAPDLVRPLRYVVTAAHGRPLERLLLRLAGIAWRVVPPLLTPGTRPRASRYGSPAGAGVPDWPADGALIFEDCQIRSPERLTVALVRAAAAAGARVANHAEALGCRRQAGGGVRVRVVDRLDGREGTVGARKVLLAAGVWTPALWARWGLDPRPVAFARGRHLILDSVPPAHALALPWPAAAHDGADDGAGGRIRRLFVSPWEGRTLAGASFEPVEGPVPEPRPEPEADLRFLERMREAFPALPSLRGSILHSTVGTYPAFGRRRPPSEAGEVSRKPLFVAHDPAGGTRGGPERGGSGAGGPDRDIHSVIPSKLTTARAVAAEALDRMFPGARRPTDDGGPLEGTRGDLAALGSPAAPVAPRDPALEAAVAHAVEEEMARTLRDVLFRRTHLGCHGPTEELVRAVAARMGSTLGWDEVRMARELGSVRRAGHGRES